jgi:hypothetical protein
MVFCFGNAFPDERERKPDDGTSFPVCLDATISEKMKKKKREQTERLRNRQCFFNDKNKRRECM